MNKDRESERTYSTDDGVLSKFLSLESDGESIKYSYNYNTVYAEKETCQTNGVVFW